MTNGSNAPNRSIYFNGPSPFIREAGACSNRGGSVTIGDPIPPRVTTGDPNPQPQARDPQLDEILHLLQLILTETRRLGNN